MVQVVSQVVTISVFVRHHVVQVSTTEVSVVPTVLQVVHSDVVVEHEV